MKFQTHFADEESTIEDEFRVKTLSKNFKIGILEKNGIQLNLTGAN